MAQQSFIAAEEEEGCRLDVVLAARLSISRARSQRLIDAGLVSVAGLAGSKHRLLREGDAVAFEDVDVAGETPVAAAIPLDIRYEDEDLIVLSKQAGLVVHPAAGHREDTLVNALLYRYPGIWQGDDSMRPGIVHRLDKMTSGLMLVARNVAARDTLVEMMRAREIKRTYIALVHGTFPAREGNVDAPIARHPRERKRMAVLEKGGREARTDFRVLEGVGETASLLRVTLDTERTHQIRVHMAFIGHPVVGDPVYGKVGEIERRTGLARQFLHACRLELPHPRTREPLDLSDDIPADLASALLELRA
ncbi:MAG: RluA family pseudouridine synthase [Candidatus Geothermincolia bacterium]